MISDVTVRPPGRLSITMVPPRLLSYAMICNFRLLFGILIREEVYRTDNVIKLTLSHRLFQISIIIISSMLV